LAGTAAGGMAALALAGAPAFAQGAADVASESIIVTATKRAGGVDVQDVPIAMTAYDSAQLDARYVRDLQDLSGSMPNVQLADVGTARGVANFSIRGLGINSSIPSVDPTVGVFVDGMYLGITSGVVLDMFDLDGVEVLRGPQGLLFGRNVTGGAVLLRTTAPSKDKVTVDAKASVETGLDYRGMASVSGPVDPDGKVAVKVAGYYNKDEGWFKNDLTGANIGGSETWMMRPAVSVDITNSLSTILRLEHGQILGDNPPSQNHAISDRHTFDVDIDNPGYSDAKWDQAISETNWRLPVAKGVVTNIAGYRRFFSKTGNDIDSLPISVFDARSITNQEQFSDELRFSGTFEQNLDVTAGLYYLKQSLGYEEERKLFSAYVPVVTAIPALALNGIRPATLTGGGDQDQWTWAAFSQFDMHFTPTFTFNAGVRYTYENKDAQINTLAVNAAPPTVTPFNGGAGCSITANGGDGSCVFGPNLSDIPDPLHAALVAGGAGPFFSFTNSHNWHNVDAKLGFQWQPEDAVQFYGFWTSGFRSGGYNFRISPTTVAGFDQSPGPTNPEKVDDYELGVKYSDPDGRYRLDLGGYYTKINDMQREVNLPGPLGVAQFIRNTANATIAGFEGEGQYKITDALLMTGFVGYTDANYDKVLFDLSCDGQTPALCSPTGTPGPDDLALKLPRVSPWTWGAGLIYDLPVGSFGNVTTHLDFSHTDKAFYTDDNQGWLNAYNDLSASVGFAPMSGPWSVSVYGKNLLNKVTNGGDTQLPNATWGAAQPVVQGVFGIPFAGPFGGPGASFTPLNKGTVVGVEAQIKY
jgi:iron complex outermembrane receptor protein